MSTTRHMRLVKKLTQANHNLREAARIDAASFSRRALAAKLEATESMLAQVKADATSLQSKLDIITATIGKAFGYTEEKLADQGLAPSATELVKMALKALNEAGTENKELKKGLAAATERAAQHLLRIAELETAHKNACVLNMDLTAQIADLQAAEEMSA